MMKSVKEKKICNVLCVIKHRNFNVAEVHTWSRFLRKLLHGMPYFDGLHYAHFDVTQSSSLVLNGNQRKRQLRKVITSMGPGRDSSGFKFLLS